MNKIFIMILSIIIMMIGGISLNTTPAICSGCISEGAMCASNLGCPGAFCVCVKSPYQGIGKCIGTF